MKFYHKDIVIEVPEGIYYPREDSLLIAEAIEEMELKGKNALEIGCGSGFLSILMAKSGAAVMAADINAEAIETAKKNAENNGFFNLHFAVSDLFEKMDGCFDIIIFNPPYLPKEEGEAHDLTYSGGPTGREIIEKFIAAAGKYIKENGKILFLISSLTGEKEVLNIFEKNGFLVAAIKRKKIPWEELIVMEARQKTS